MPATEGSARRVLITGGSGFIGTNLVAFYLGKGAQVLNLDHSRPRKPDLERLWTRVDLLDREKLHEAVRSFSPTHVLHMGARTDLVGHGIADYAANTAGVENVIEALTGIASLERVIFASSRMVCEIGYQPRHETDYCPATVYGESKVEMERIVRSKAHGLPWMLVRLSSIWGPWFGVPYKDFFLAIARGRYVHMGTRTIHKSFGFVGNSVYQLDRLLSARSDRVIGKTLYLADYPPLEVRHWAELIRSRMGSPRIRTVPYAVLRTAAIVGDGLRRAGWRGVPLTSFRLDNLLTEMVYDVRPLEEIVGPLPYSLDEGTARTIAWLREQGELPS